MHEIIWWEWLYWLIGTQSIAQTLQTYLHISWIQLLTKHLCIRVRDVSDAEEALQATRQADCHLEVCYVLNTTQQQHTLPHILQNQVEVW